MIELIKNPFPADGDASKIPKFTDFLICLRENRKKSMVNILRPLLDRANLGDVGGTHDLVIVGEIGRGKTHLLKFLEKKLVGKKVKLVAESFEIPSYNNILPVYVKLDASMTMKPELFVYFFINYVFGFNVKDFGIINSPIFQNNRKIIKQKLSKLYENRIKDVIEKPRTLTTQQAMDLLFDACNEISKVSDKTSVLFLFDELEGVILSAHKKTEESLNLVMDFFRQFHDEINKEVDIHEKLYALYAMTAPAYEKAEQARQESGAWLSRLRSYIVDIPPFSEEELEAIVSCALNNEDLFDTRPFTKDAISYIYRSVMGQPRYAIEALHNAYQLHLEKKTDLIGSKEIFGTTTWLNPNIVIDNNRVAKLKSEIGSRYSYLIDLFSSSIQESNLSLNEIIAQAQRNLPGEVTEDRVIEDLKKFYPAYIDISENTKTVKVLQAFYNRILRQLEKQTIETEVLLEPTKIIESFSEQAPISIKTGKISENERSERLSEALCKVIKQLFETEGFSQTILENGFRLFQVSRSKKGEIFRVLAKPIINEEEVNHAEIIDLIEKNNVSSVLFLIDLDDRIKEDKLKRKVENIALPPSHPWVNPVFSGCFSEETENWKSKKILDKLTDQLNLSQICIMHPVSYGKREFRGKNISSKSAQIDVRGLWYSMTVLTRDFPAQFSQQLEETLRYMIQDFFGSLRKEIIEKSLVKEAGINDLLKYTNTLIGNARTLMENKTCRDAIAEQGTLTFRDLPSNIGPNVMNRFTDLGLFVKKGPRTWQANSINDARRYDPWICFIVMNYISGKRKKQINNILRNSNIGPYTVGVVKCLNFYLQLLESFELIKEDQLVLVDNQSRLNQRIQVELERIKQLKTLEFAGSINTLTPFSEKIDGIKQNTELIEKNSKTPIQKDNRYRSNLHELEIVSEELENVINKKRELTQQTNSQIDSLFSQAETVYSKSVSIFNSLNFNDKDSDIIRSLIKNPELKNHVLNIPLKLKPPHLMPSLISKKIELEQTLSDGYLANYLKESENFLKKLNAVIEESRALEAHITNVVSDYLKEIRQAYENLLVINHDFQIGSKNEISTIIGDTHRRISNEDFVESLIYAGKANHLFLEYCENIIKHAINVKKIKIDELTALLKKQNSFLARSIQIIKKKIKNPNESTIQELIDLLNTIDKKICSIDLLKPSSIKNKKPQQISIDIISYTKAIIGKETEIRRDIDSLNMKIRDNNRSVFKGAIVKLLDFISKNGGINSLNFSDFIKYMGSREECEKIIPEIIEMGLGSFKMEVEK